jgi:hypothetical protein
MCLKEAMKDNSNKLTYEIPFLSIYVNLFA